MRLRLTTRFVLTFVLVAAALLTGVGVLTYRNGSASLQVAVLSEVGAKVIEKEAAVNRWIEERMRDMRLLAEGLDPTQKASQLLAAAPGSKAERSARELFLQEITPQIAGAGFLELFLTEPERGCGGAAASPLLRGTARRACLIRRRAAWQTALPSFGLLFLAQFASAFLHADTLGALAETMCYLFAGLIVCCHALCSCRCGRQTFSAVRANRRPRLFRQAAGSV